MEDLNQEGVRGKKVVLQFEKGGRKETLLIQGLSSSREEKGMPAEEQLR